MVSASTLPATCEDVRVGALARWGSASLGAVTDAPRLEAEILLARATGLARPLLLAYPERLLSVPDVAAYRGLVCRRVSGYPLPYLTGKVEFYGLEFAVTPEVLIPRPETETLVDLGLAWRPGVVVDVGTGSGCVAVALAACMPWARVYATDLSAAALRVAAANARRHGVHGRVRLIQCDLAGPLAGPADLVVSNPPYVAEREWALLPESVRRHEPRLALDGGTDGLAVIRRLLAAGPRVLKPGGTLLVEIGASQGAAATAAARSLLPGASVSVHPDLGGRARVLEVVLPARPPGVDTASGNRGRDRNLGQRVW
jgi:release factor glutamine methyltransferase